MRSILLAVLALAVPVASATAAPTPNLFHHTAGATAPATAKPQRVHVTFRNTRMVDCVLVIGDTNYLLHKSSSLPLYVETGSNVQIYSGQDSRLHGQTLLNVTSADADRTVTVQ